MWRLILHDEQVAGFFSLSQSNRRVSLCHRAFWRTASRLSSPASIMPPLSDMYHFMSQSCSPLIIFTCLTHAQHSQRYKTMYCDSHKVKTIPQKQTILYCLIVIPCLVSFQHGFFLPLCSIYLFFRDFWLQTTAPQPSLKWNYCVMKANINLKFPCISGAANNC